MGMNTLLLISRQGKIRLSKWYSPLTLKERERQAREITSQVLSRPRKLCNFLEWKGQKIVYKRYASLYFVAVIDKDDNELICLEMIHHFVEVLDRYFGSVCELDIIFNFHKAYYIVDELFIGGNLAETSKKRVLSVCAAQDDLMDASNERTGKKLFRKR
jgi:AP-1 complex subunit sigma 1/2